MSMRVKKIKRVKTILAFYRNSFQMRPPYMVLCDGNFIFAASDISLDLSEALNAAFKGQAHAKCPDCILNELKALKGRTWQPAQKYAAEKCQRFHCAHKPKRPAACIMETLRSGFIGAIATQDSNLRRSVHRDFPQIPVLFIGEGLQILPPPKSLRAKVDAELSARYVPVATEADDKKEADDKTEDVT